MRSDQLIRNYKELGYTELPANALPDEDCEAVMRKKSREGKHIYQIIKGGTSRRMIVKEA